MSATKTDYTANQEFVNEQKCRDAIWQLTTSADKTGIDSDLITPERLTMMLNEDIDSTHTEITNLHLDSYRCYATMVAHGAVLSDEHRQTLERDRSLLRAFLDVYNQILA